MGILSAGVVICSTLTWLSMFGKFKVARQLEQAGANLCQDQFKLRIAMPAKNVAGVLLIKIFVISL